MTSRLPLDGLISLPANVLCTLATISVRIAGEPHADAERREFQIPRRSAMDRSVSHAAPVKSTPLGAVLVVTFLASLGTGVFWNGLSFIAKHAYGFDQVRNLILYALLGAVYALGAFFSAWIARRLQRFVQTRGLLVWTLVIQAAACVLPIAWSGEWALWIAATAVTIASSLMWPIVESYLTAGRHGPSMRSAIGWFNLTWMPAVVVPMFIMAPLLEEHGRWAIGGLSGAGLLALLFVGSFAQRPADHDAGMAAAHMSPLYPQLLRSLRVLLPLSYVLTSVMAPILPYRFEQLGIDVHLETPSTATWMIVRVAALLVMWKLPFWHGRWGTLLMGAISMTVGFGLVVLAPAYSLVLVGFAIMGIGLGVIYYAALYYAMAVGGAAVEASGRHEALIGAGYAVGPLAGLAGTALGGGPAIVAIVWLLVAVGAIPATRPYVRSRRLVGESQARVASSATRR